MVCVVLPRSSDRTKLLQEAEVVIVDPDLYHVDLPKVEYRLTPLGQTLIELLDAIRVWSETHLEAVLEAQQAFDSQNQETDEEDDS